MSRKNNCSKNRFKAEYLFGSENVEQETNLSNKKCEQKFERKNNLWMDTQTETKKYIYKGGAHLKNDYGLDIIQ